MGNKDHIGRLLQLLLGVAINCSGQAEHIQHIMAMEAGLEKTRFKKKKKKTSPVCFLGFFLGFLVFFWVFWVFLDFFGFFLYICPEERVFRVFLVSRILLGASRL
jgi:hypothetical protein